MLQSCCLPSVACANPHTHGLSQRTHWIPQRQDNGLLLQHVPHLLGQKPGVHDGLVDKLVHPGVAHDEPALVAGRGAPAVLHPPPHRLARLLVQVHGREDHGVRHQALARLQPLRLVHAQQAGVDASLVVEQVQVHDARHPVAELADVAAEEDGQASLEHLDARRLERIHLHVDVRDVAAADDVAQPRDGQLLQHLVARVVHQRDHALDGVRGDAEVGAVNVFGKGPGRRLDLARLAVLVDVVPRELVARLGRLPQQQRHDEGNLLDHDRLVGRDDRRRHRHAVAHVAQRQRVLAQLGLDDAVEDARVLRVPAVRIQALRHQAVLFHQVVHHVPLAAVRDDVAQQPLHHAALEVLLGRLHNLLEEPVGLFELVPVEEVCLGQLKRLQVVALHQRHAENVCRGEQPAAPAGPLVGDGISFKGNVHVEDLLVRNLG